MDDGNPIMPPTAHPNQAGAPILAQATIAEARLSLGRCTAAGVGVATVRAKAAARVFSAAVAAVRADGRGGVSRG